ncbi:MAG: beta-propeller fold lactonase family protein [Chloroflexi bacterium]|nr:beta-propeller fold lactonase family protein [Chloroflexota bacterium]
MAITLQSPVAKHSRGERTGWSFSIPQLSGDFMFTALSIRRRTFAGLLLLAGALAVLTSQAGSASAKPLASGAVYTLSNAATGNQVIAFQRADDGTLTPAGSFDTGGTGNGGNLGSQGALALSRNGRYIVAVNAGSDSVSLLAVRPSGLELLDTAAAQGTTPISVTIHGDIVYVVNDGSDNIAGFRIDDDSLHAIPGSVQTLGAGAAPGQISFDSRGRTLVVSVKNTNQLVTFQVDDEGRAGAGQATASAAPVPFGFAIDHKNHAIVSEAPGSDLSSYQLAKDGTVTLIDGPVGNGQAAACWVALSKDDRYAFSANAGNSTISTYRVEGDGSLTLLFPVAGNTIGGPLDLAVSNDGHFLYAISRASHTISEFAIGDDGSLAFIGSTSDLPTASASGLVAK